MEVERRAGRSFPYHSLRGMSVQFRCVYIAIMDMRSTHVSISLGYMGMCNVLWIVIFEYKCLKVECAYVQ